MQIRYLREQDVDAAKLVADANRDALGFLPEKKLKEAASQKRCFVALVDQTIVGFVVFRHRQRDKQTTLSDICVDASKRRCRVGTALINHLLTDCKKRQRDFILLKCPEGLEANFFYQHTGFTLQRIEQGKSRKLKVWHLPVADTMKEET